MRYILYLLLISVTQLCYGAELPLETLKLPPGFSISIYAAPVPGARSMTLGSNSIVFVGSISEGKVYAIVSNQNATDKTKVLTIASGLIMPNGVVFYQNNLYVADVDRILRFDNVENHLSNPPKPIIIVSNLPKDRHHGWRYLRIGPDKKLYVSIGAPCNNCLSEDQRYATIMRMNLDGSHQEVFARGIRNSLGFDWDPTTHQLAFTDNGRDWMGDDLPPEELNYAVQPNQHFGFPYCYGKNVADSKHGHTFSCSSFVPPVLELPAHVAPLGMTFYTGNMFPVQYQHNIFIAEHGSWNRSHKSGYQVIAVSRNDKVWTAKTFITGWLQNESVWGRPVDLLVMPDGSLLISDDYAGVIYRVTYSV